MARQTRKDIVSYPVAMAAAMDRDYEAMKFARFIHGGEEADPLRVAASLFNAGFRALARLAEQDGDRVRLIEHIHSASYEYLTAPSAAFPAVPSFNPRPAPPPAARDDFNRPLKPQ